MYDDHNQDMVSTLLKELLKKPSFKDDFRAILKSIDGPDVGRELAKTFMWQDIEFSLGFLAGLPALVNVLIRVFEELLAQLGDKIPPELLYGFMKSLLDDLDTASMTRAIQNLSAMLDRFVPLFSTASDLRTFITEQGPVLAARGINTGTVSINKLCQQDPALLSTFLARAIDNLDKPALHDAALNMVDAVLDQKLGLIALTGGLLKRRGVKVLKRLGLRS